MDVLARSLLTRSPFFGALQEPVLDYILSLAAEREFPAGHTVFREGDLGHSMYVVLAGDLVVSRTGGSGRLIRLMHLGAGDTFGETTLVEMRPRSLTVMVMKAARLLELTNKNLYQLYGKDRDAYVLVLQNINRELCRRLYKEETRITEVADLAQEEDTQIRTREEILQAMKANKP